MTCLGTCLCLLETAESKIPQTRWTEPLDPVRQELIFNCFPSLKDSRQNPFSGPFPKRPSLFPCPSPQPKTSWISPLILENAAYCSCCFCQVFSALSTLKELKRGLRGDHSSLYSESRAFYGTSSNEMKWWLRNKSKSELKLEKKKKSCMLLSQAHLKGTNPPLCSWFVPRSCYSHMHTLTLSSLISWGRVWKKFRTAAPGDGREIMQKHRACGHSPTCLQAGRLW